MKKQTVSLLVFLLATSGYFSSCNNTVNKNTGALEFDSIRVNETSHLFGDTAKPACNLIVRFTYAAKSSDIKLRDSLNNFLVSAFFGDKYINMKPEEAIKKYTEKYINDYRNDLEPMYKKDEQEQEEGMNLEGWYSFYRSVEGRVKNYFKHLLVYRIDYNEYTGGAHGIYMATFLNMDLHTLSPVRLDDLFANDYKEALTDLLWNQLMADNKVKTRQELEDIGYATTGELAPTENFYLTPQGITFYYNVYDIAPYVMGPIEITLPYEIMQHLLKDDCMVLNEIRNS
ncbi:DUF3298 and DUF4163 domain-containing protein [Bacteroides heparinolyticus]|uniref:DUF3298 and DUF4163 domain-containing protein n=1 Tax=Prevotella heparinolytica TaxID=28113 RepID=UPI0023F39EF4|nr:DUF3298 and DUF4163 domain-containing protein [Bacteroides heparinolyticus]MCI6213705.1 DUF3298 and DUF4163 domain-containing protein [Bacteroides heparinolyticus]